jgi:hypothetical protein
MNKILSYTMIITEKKIEYKIKFILLKLKKKKKEKKGKPMFQILFIEQYKEHFLFFFTTLN